MARPKTSTVLVCGTSESRYARDETIMHGLGRIPGWHVVDGRFRSDRWDDWFLKRTACHNVVVRLVKKALWLRAKRLILTRQVDALVLMKLNPGWFAMVKRVARECGVPVIYDLWVSRYLVAERDGRDTAAAWREEGMIVKESACLMATSEAYREFYSEKYGCHPDKILPVPLGVPDEWLAQRRNARNDDGLFVVAYWGSFLKQHGLEVALDSAELLSGHRDIRFRFYGKLPDHLRAKLGTGGSGNLEYGGHIMERAQMIAHVDETNVGFGHLRPIHDAHLMLPNKALEAMARSKVVMHIEAPALLRQYGDPWSPQGSVSFFRGAASGLAQSILYVRDNRELAARMGAAARRKIEQEHSVSAVANGLERCLHAAAR